MYKRFRTGSYKSVQTRFLGLLGLLQQPQMTLERWSRHDFVRNPGFKLVQTRHPKSLVFARVSAIPAEYVYKTPENFRTAKTVVPQWFQPDCTICTSFFINLILKSFLMLYLRYIKRFPQNCVQMVQTNFATFQGSLRFRLSNHFGMCQSHPSPFSGRGRGPPSPPAAQEETQMGNTEIEATASLRSPFLYAPFSTSQAASVDHAALSARGKRK